MGYMRKKISGHVAWDRKLSNENRGSQEGKTLTRKTKVEIPLWKMGREKSSTLSQDSR